MILFFSDLLRDYMLKTLLFKTCHTMQFDDYRNL